MQDNIASQEFLSGLVCEGVVQQDDVLCFGVLCGPEYCTVTLAPCSLQLGFRCRVFAHVFWRMDSPPLPQLCMR